jgi:hypothetical protein
MLSDKDLFKKLLLKNGISKKDLNRFCKGGKGGAVPITNLVGLLLFWMSR